MEDALFADERAELRKRVGRVRSLVTLTESDLWSSHQNSVFKADGFSGTPLFYPVYRWDRYYSYSPFLLLLKKGRFCPTDAFLRHDRTLAREVARPTPLIDREIERIGGPACLTLESESVDSFCRRMAESMQHDVAEVERRNPGKTNVVLCGGADSCNLLLLSWRNPVVAYSAMPNLPLVREFVRRNGLDIEVLELFDTEDACLRRREIAESFGLVSLENWKWTAHLRKIAEEAGGQLIIWKGQVADAFLTGYWRYYTYRKQTFHAYMRRCYGKLAEYLPSTLDRVFARWAIADFQRSLWERAAVLQGSHMGFLRSISDCLVLSGYHGPKTMGVWTSFDLKSIGNGDLRPGIGQCLFGKQVWYPAANPAPPPSRFRAGFRSRRGLLEAFAWYGISVSESSRRPVGCILA